MRVRGNKARRAGLGRAQTVGCLLFGALMPAMTAVAQETVETEPAAQGEAPVLLNTLEVTANKRPQALGEVDGSVAVRTDEDLREAGVRTVEELDKVFPGLVIRKRGNRAYTNFSLRGITSPDFYNPSVQVYVDGVPQDPAYFTQELVDVERVELLRGPQGTLYGRNAHGGVINIITRKPDNELRGRLSGTLSTHERAVDAGLSGPLVEDMIYGALDISRDDYVGQIHDLATGDDNIDDSRTWFGRAKLSLAPKDGPFSLSLTAQHDELVSHEELYISEANLEGLDFDSVAQGGVNELKRNVDTVALTAAYDFGGATLTSVTSYQDRDISKRLIQGFDTPEFQDTFSEELRLEFAFGERWNGVTGLYFQDTDFSRETPAFAPFFGTSKNKVDTESYAAFGEVTYALTESVDVTGGLRWSYEDASIEYARVAPSPLSIEDDDSFQDISPKIALGWQVTEEHRLYALASRGFKPGGFNHTLPFALMTDDVAVSYDSETSTNVELGWRGSFFDDRIEAGASAYWILTEDKQIYVGPVGSQYLRNAGEAESYGVDLEARIHATEDLTLDLGANVGRSEFTDARDPDTSASYDGNRVPFAPDYTLQAATYYLVPQDFLDGDIGLRLAGTYVSRTYFDEANDLSQPGYLLLDASVELLLDNGFSLRLFVDNITDEIYRTYSYESGGTVFSSVGDGRVVGLSGRFEF